MLATLAGACAGIALFVLVGEQILGSCLSQVHHEPDSHQGVFALISCPMIVIVRGLGALWLGLVEARSVSHVLWSGVCTLTLATIGIFSLTAC